MRILLIRHAQSSGQHPDADLTAEGHAQAQALIPRLAALGVREIFSSPYRRAIATVAPFADQAGLTIQTIGDLRERKLAEGWLPDFLIHMERSFADENYRLPGGESLAETASRGLRGLTEAMRLAKSPIPALASHGNLIASILRTIDPGFGFAAWQAMRNPHLFEVEWENGKPARLRDFDIKLE
jgi:2,3-bisphosphoglycerate-dependent phosphoglycerate mutase